MNHQLNYVLGLVLIVSQVLFFACQPTQQAEFVTKTATDANGYKYEFVENDPSNTHIYTLENGLKVYLSVYKDEPRIQTYIPVKAGGKFDPANSTGLAHYLEHMMFKGTSSFGTKDWAAEKIFLDSIENMFEHYRTLTDSEERKEWYKKIDQVSYEASKLAIANEYDKLCTIIGATGTNAYTTEDRTVYINNIPSNQIENFLAVEGNRFSMIVNRIFHTELEAVYEEKNRSLDNDFWKSYEAMYKEMFTNHPYGTQTVIGTIEHLKNPSITDINAYFDKYYVPNNMAVCMAGDLDPEKTIQLVDKYFGKLATQPLEAYNAPEEPALTQNKSVEIFGPEKDRLSLGFRFGGTSSADFHLLQMVDFMLANSSAGLIDLNLVQKQKVLAAGCYVDALNDYSIHTFYGEPREGQSLEEVQDLILDQIEQIKNGEFEDWLVEAVINDFKKSKMKALESNYSRANDMVMAFTNNMAWADYISLIKKMENVTKEDLVKFANDHYNHYVVIYKRNGEDPNKLEVEKPAITKVDVDRETQSEFFQRIKNNKVEEIQPVFLDYQKDLQQLTMKSNIPVLMNQNTENELFTLYYLLETGTNENPKIKLALDYLKYLGTANLSAEDFKKEMYKLGCDFNVFSSNDRIYVYLSGLSENMEPALKLFEDLLVNAQPDEEALKNMVSDTHKTRTEDKKSKNRILWGGLMNYAKYGASSPFTNVLSNEELNDLQAAELIQMVKDLTGYEHQVMYYGPLGGDQLIGLLDQYHNVPDQLKPLPEKRLFATLDTEDPKVFFTDYDMVQAEMVLQSRGPKYDHELTPEVRLFNEYFGAGMSSIVFQEIREAQGLAYSVFSSYQQGSKVEDNDVMMAYVGTQADKQKEALEAMIDLLNNLPETEKNFVNAKKAILNKIESNRITKTSVLFNYIGAKRLKLKYDIRKDIYNRVSEMTFDDLKNFHTNYIKGNQYNIAVIGDENKMNFAALSAQGEVVKLSLDEIFGYEENNVQVPN